MLGLEDVDEKRPNLCLPFSEGTCIEGWEADYTRRIWLMRREHATSLVD
jgi:hypothetical protein